MRLIEYGVFIVDAPDPAVEGGTVAMTDSQLAASRRTGGTPLDAVVRPVELDATPFEAPSEYTVYDPRALGEHGLKATVEVGDGGLAKLTVDTVPPIEAEGILFRLDTSKRSKSNPTQLTFMPHLEVEKTGSMLQKQRVQV